VALIDTGTLTVAATIPFTGGAYYVSPSFSQDSAFAYVTGGVGTTTLTVINTATKTVATTVTVGSDPAGVAVMGTVKVSTVAGGYVGDRGPATKAALGPGSSVLDSAGNLYISDFIGGNRIRKVDTTGAITTYAGTGICGYNGDKIAASKATICAPDGLALDPSGNLVFVDDGNARIRRIDHSTGKITTIAGNGVFGYDANQDGGPALSAEIGQPAQIAYDAAGNLYFDQVSNCVVRKVDTSGIIHTVAGTATCGYNGDNIPATTAQLNLPHGVATDSSGNVYIGDSANHRIRKVDTSGTITTFAGTGHRGFSCNGGLATSANVGNPRGLTISNNVLYIGNSGAEVCSVNLTTNNISLYAGSVLGYDGDGHSLLASKFSAPTSVIFDPSGNPIFDDNLNGRVRKATGGIVQTIAGGFINDGAAATSAAFTFAEALAIDKSGNLYIADANGNRIRKVSGGKISTVAGNGISGYSGDGHLGNDPNTELNDPQGVTVDSLGNVFIADTFNGVIRYVNTSGIINTFATSANFNFLLQMATDSSTTFMSRMPGLA
jgi:YVTN family beta-propeller protein